MIAKIRKGVIFSRVIIYSDMGVELVKYEQVGRIFFNAKEVELAFGEERTFQISDYSYIRIGNTIMLKG